MRTVIRSMPPVFSDSICREWVLLRRSETARSGRNRRDFEHRDAVGFRVGTDGTQAHPLVGPRLDEYAMRRGSRPPRAPLRECPQLAGQPQGLRHHRSDDSGVALVTLRSGRASTMVVRSPGTPHASGSGSVSHRQGWRGAHAATPRTRGDGYSQHSVIRPRMRSVASARSARSWLRTVARSSVVRTVLIVARPRSAGSSQKPHSSIPLGPAAPSTGPLR